MNNVVNVFKRLSSNDLSKLITSCLGILVKTWIHQSQDVFERSDMNDKYESNNRWDRITKVSFVDILWKLYLCAICFYFVNCAYVLVCLIMRSYLPTIFLKFWSECFWSSKCLLSHNIRKCLLQNVKEILTLMGTTLFKLF